MQYRDYLFGSTGTVRAGTRYAPGGAGFVTEAEQRTQPELRIFELNNGFAPPYWYAEEPLCAVQEDEAGCWTDSDAQAAALWARDGAPQPGGARRIPLYFKAALPCEGRWRVSVTLTARADEEELLLFLGRRHLVWRGALRKGQTLRRSFAVSVCEVIPNSETAPHPDATLDIAVVGHCPALDRVQAEEADGPTVYLAGDSTMADYGADVPYHPAACYGGWGQAFDAFLDGSVAVCNQAHNGRTTEAFCTEGHFDLVLRHIRPGDYFMMQFGHNDQKHPHLQAYNGYPENLARLAAEVRAKGAYPLILTPIARNTWTVQDGQLTYNDLLHDHAEACFRVGERENIPVLDLHGDSMARILALGRDGSRPYFHQDDYTHANDYGAYRAAGYVAAELRALGGAFDGYAPLVNAVTGGFGPWQPCPAPLLQKPARLAALTDPDAPEEQADHEAEKTGGDALTQLLEAVRRAKQ